MSTTQATSTREVRNFVESGRPGHIHEAWKMTQCTYDPISGQYVQSDPQSISTIAAGPTANFKALMQAFQTSYPADPSKDRFDMRRAHCWNDVLLEAGMAREQYQAKTKGLRGIFTKSGRKAGEIAPGVKPFVDSMPQGDYGSLVCGGAKLLLNACKRMADIREKIMEALGDSADLLEQVELFVSIFPKDQKLNERAVQLYIALLVTLEGCMVWFGHGPWDRMKSILQQDFYGRSVDEKITALRVCTRQVREQADICDKQRTAEIAEAIEKLQSSTDEGFAAVGDHLDDVQTDIGGVKTELEAGFQTATTNFGDLKTQMGSGFEGVAQGQQKHFDQMESVQASQTESATFQRNSHVEMVNALNALQQQLAGTQEVFQWQANAQRQQARIAELEARNRTLESTRDPPLTPHDIQRLIGPVHGAGGLYITYFLQLSQAINSTPILTQLIMTLAPFQRWFTSRTSQFLFIDPGTPLAKTSSGTFVTAALAHVLSNTPPAIVLTHFSRTGAPDEPENASLDDPAATLVASLVTQLLATRHHDLHVWSIVTSLHDHHAALGARDLAYMCSLFKHLIRHLSHGVVFCLLDDFFALEQNAPPESVDKLIGTLSEVVEFGREGGERVTVKVLAMTPDRKGRVLRFAPRGDVLRVEGAEREAEGGGALTEREVRFRLEVARRKAGGEW